MPMTMTLPCYGGREGTRTFRLPVDLAEAIAHVERNHQFWYRSYDARKGAVRVRKNGKIKTWKRDPGRVEVPVKYGLKECVRLDANALTTRILIPHNIATRSDDVAIADAPPAGGGYDPALVG